MEHCESIAHLLQTEECSAPPPPSKILNTFE